MNAVSLVTDTRTLSSFEVVALSGASYRQVDTWTTNGVLRPDVANPGIGAQRRYPISEAVVATVMAALSSQRRPIPAAVAEQVRERLAAGDHSCTVFEEPAGIVTLVLDLARAEVLVWERLGASAGA